MKSKSSTLSNLGITTLLLALIFSPIWLVARMGGMSKPTSKGGATLGAKFGSPEGAFSETRGGEVREVSFATFWGQVATYRDALRIENENTETKEYKLEILELRGSLPEEQEVVAVFTKNGSTGISLAPGEAAGITLEITGPHHTNLESRTQSSLKLAIWEK